LGVRTNQEGTREGARVATRETARRLAQGETSLGVRAVANSRVVEIVRTAGLGATEEAETVGKGQSIPRDASSTQTKEAEIRFGEARTGTTAEAAARRG
jgi:hypothetical protein